MIALLILIPLCFCGLVLIIISLMDRKEEIEFSKKAESTIGKVVGKVSAINKFTKNTLTHDGLVAKSDGEIHKRGYLIFVEFETLKGKKYRVRSIKSYKDFDKEEVSVSYNPQDPTDVMIDSFYKVDKSSIRNRIINGALLIVVPIFFFIAIKIAGWKF